jgi:hypothetical protein
MVLHFQATNRNNPSILNILTTRKHYLIEEWPGIGCLTLGSIISLRCETAFCLVLYFRDHYI